MKRWSTRSLFYFSCSLRNQRLPGEIQEAWAIKKSRKASGDTVTKTAYFDQPYSNSHMAVGRKMYWTWHTLTNRDKWMDRPFDISTPLVTECNMRRAGPSMRSWTLQREKVFALSLKAFPKDSKSAPLGILFVLLRLVRTFPLLLFGFAMRGRTATRRSVGMGGVANAYIHQS